MCFGYGECGTNLESEARLKSRRVYNMNKEFEEIATNSNVKISPNPVKSILTVNLNDISKEGNNLIKITNLQGQTVFEKSFAGNFNQFKVDHLKNGVYLYEVTNNRNSLAKGKLIVKH